METSGAKRKSGKLGKLIWFCVAFSTEIGGAEDGNGEGWVKL